MLRDIRETQEFIKSKSFFSSVLKPGQNVVSDADHLTLHRSGRHAAFTGLIFDSLDTPPRETVCIYDLHSSSLNQYLEGQVESKLPAWSPDGQFFSLLVKNEETGLYSLRIENEQAQPVHDVSVEGVIEAYHWSPDSRNILICVAGLGADLPGVQGGATVSVKDQTDLPAWLPTVDCGDAADLWRSAYVLEVASGRLTRISPEGINIWEACWLGTKRIAAVVSSSHGEGSWYASTLVSFAANGSGDVRELYKPTDQIGWITANESGSKIAFAETVCSDRLTVCGDLMLLDMASGQCRQLDISQVDVSDLRWRTNDLLCFSGHRSLETVMGEINLASGQTRLHLQTDRYTSGAWLPRAVPHPDGGLLSLIESWDMPPTLSHLQDGNRRDIHTTGIGKKPEGLGKMQPAQWTAPDGLQIEGFILTPPGEGPFALVMDIHGGPTGLCRNKWQGRHRAARMLVDSGIAVFFPNPRGSCGRGRSFAAAVKGDMGGQDTQDYLSGIDMLVAEGIADPDRLGVTGISYGGFMSCWLITQDRRFKAALPISPVCNWYSQHRTSQIPFFDELFLQDNPFDPTGKYWTRSPVNFVNRVTTDTLLLAGEIDQNTPVTQAWEFHRGLLEAGVSSTLVTYPNAGHGIRNYPDVIDHSARSYGWFTSKLLDG